MPSTKTNTVEVGLRKKINSGFLCAMGALLVGSYVNWIFGIFLMIGGFIIGFYSDNFRNDPKGIEKKPLSTSKSTESEYRDLTDKEKLELEQFINVQWEAYLSKDPKMTRLNLEPRYELFRKEKLEEIARDLDIDFKRLTIDNIKRIVERVYKEKILAESIDDVRYRVSEIRALLDKMMKIQSDIIESNSKTNQ